MQRKKVFANRYYYEGSHGIVSPLLSSAHLFNLPSPNKQIGSHSAEKEKYSHWSRAIFLRWRRRAPFFSLLYVRSCLSSLLSLSSSLFFSLSLSLPSRFLYYKREHTSDLLLLLFDMHFYKQRRRKSPNNISFFLCSRQVHHEFNDEQSTGNVLLLFSSIADADVDEHGS